MYPDLNPRAMNPVSSSWYQYALRHYITYITYRNTNHVEMYPDLNIGGVNPI